MNLKQLSIVAVIASFAAPLMAEEYMNRDSKGPGMSAMEKPEQEVTGMPSDSSSMSKDSNADASKPDDKKPAENPQPGNSSPQTTDDNTNPGNDNTQNSNQDNGSKSIYGY